MKIGINLIQYTDRQGIEVFAQNLIEHLIVAPGDEVILFTNQWSQSLIDQRPAAVRVINHDFKKLTRLALIIYQQWRLPRLLRAEKIDVLFCPSLALPLFYRKKVVTIHDLAFWRFREESRFWSRLFLYPAIWSAKHFSLAIVTVSEFAKQEISRLLRIDSDKISNISEGVPVQYRLNPSKPATAPQPTAKPYFLYLGNMYPRKNLAGLIMAFKIFSARRPAYSLIIAGKQNSLMPALERLIQELKLDRQVRFTGFIPEEDKGALIQQAVALVLVSRYEGFGLPVLEAQSLGVPVLAARAASLPEVAGDAAILVDPEDIAAIATGLAKLADDQALRLDLIERGYENVKRYSWNDSADRLYRICQQCFKL
ncbi:MAG: glycosyltransferase family 1 protein [Patescibacteria group bacterium]